MHHSLLSLSGNKLGSRAASICHLRCCRLGNQVSATDTTPSSLAAAGQLLSAQLHIDRTYDLVLIVQVSTTDSEVSQAATFAAEQLSSQSNSLSALEVKEVLNARSKVAAGKVFELKLKLSQGSLPEQIVQAST